MNRNQVVDAIAVCVLVVAIGGVLQSFAGAQEKPSTPPMVATPPVTICAGQSPCNEAVRTKILAAYARALVLQNNQTQAQSDFQRAAAEYQGIMQEGLKEEKLAPGSVYQVNVALGTVYAQTPTTPTTSSTPPTPPASANGTLPTPAHPAPTTKQK